MAGLGRKVWSAGEVLAAADVNGYLMDQTVMVFDDAAARGSAIGTATEGMVTYLKDTNAVEVYTGSSFEPLSPTSPNYIINGAFDIWQRGTSLTGPLSGTPFLADRWACTDASGTANLSQQTFAPGEIEAASFGNAKYFHRMDVTTNAAFTRLETKLEGVDILAGQTATISFWAKGVNPTGGDGLRVYLQQVFGSGGSSTVSSTANFPTLTSSWQRFAYMVTLPSISGKTIGAGDHLKLLFDTNSSDPTAWTLDIWGVQLEAGSVATPFRRNANSIQGELAACQRYCQVYDATSQGGLANMFVALTTRAQGAFSFPVMRAAPTATFSASNTFEFIHEATATTLSSGPSFNNTNTSNTRIVGDVASGLTVGNAAMLRFVGGAGGSITLSAEL